MSADPRAGALLYVEDEVLIQQLVECELRDAGFGLVLAADAEEALEILDSGRYQIQGLITDVNLGAGADGWAVARHARELISGLPVIYVSGKDGHEWTSSGVPNSVMITKPFVPTQIVVAISSLLNAAEPHN
ncbi:response regulator [Brevundimonas sp. BR2-1]|uniref:response regulator n=1 Tax=unclassified Brevundimonas TaxID=2622653 RepID=UPI001222D68A|nr:response regulator [Brevundimonas sp.]MBU3971016.1 response regulator [Alphaproteobacteria bacterium]MBA3049886.1 response regulator [Brevundimonas sp.]MBU3972838.1 response regulator [Alphaproteobacteria bacterium]MBU4039892.1 response regulator [Alphaproteobacteria bacterium]MBU4137395.1 response regulator [Alphaproteobacteria bacterium]